MSAVLASKCLKGKPATVGRAAEACLLLVELEQQAVVVEALLKAFTDKVPKVVLAAVDIVLQAIRWALKLKVPPPAPAPETAAEQAAEARSFAQRLLPTRSGTSGGAPLVLAPALIAQPLADWSTTRAAAWPTPPRMLILPRRAAARLARARWTPSRS